MPRIRACLVVLCLALTLGGCATSRSVVGVEQGAVAPAPDRGEAVRIARVTDARVFSANPPQADMPSLNKDDVGNAELTARAIGRKRGGFGLALGDVLLPPGQTVGGLVGEAVAAGFRKAGYRVLGQDDPGYAQAVPVEATVRQFWGWFSPGFWSVRVTNRSEVLVQVPLPVLKDGAVVRGGAVISGGAIFESDWQAVTANGARNLSDNIAATLNGQPAVPPPEN